MSATADAVPGTARDLADSVLRPIRSHHAFEGCVEQVATAIRLGIFANGQMLPGERELADRLGVSRSSLREAIAALRAAGLVKTVRGRGGGNQVVYAAASPGSHPGDLSGRTAELRDTLVYRRIVEPGAAFLAAETVLSAAQQDFLGWHLAAVAEAPDASAHRMADSRLHLAIASLTGSPSVIDAVTTVQARLHEMLTTIPVLGRNIAHSTDQHEAIVQAIIDSEPEQARRVMEQHCDDTAALLRGLLGSASPGAASRDNPPGGTP